MFAYVTSYALSNNKIVQLDKDTVGFIPRQDTKHSHAKHTQAILKQTYMAAFYGHEIMTKKLGQ